MKDSIHKYFKVGTIQWMSYPNRGLVQSVKDIARDDYFDAIEVGFIPTDAEREAVRDILAQSHLTVCYGAQKRLLGQKLNPNDLNEDARRAAERALTESVDEAAYLGAAGMAFLSGKWQAETRDEAFGQLIKTTTAVCGYAAKKGITVNLEVFDYDMDKASLIGPAPYAAMFAAEMRNRCANFGLMADLSHFPTTYETSRFVIQTLRPYINHFHIGNAVVKKGCEAYGDTHTRFGFPNGANDTAELLTFFKILKAEGFFRPEDPYVLSFEVKPWGNEDEDIIMANSKRVINRAWAMLDD